MNKHSADNRPRVIARYNGQKPGALLIVIGGIHGNEKAGIKAIKLVKKMLDVEPVTNPDFCYQGNFVGLIGNITAGRENQRFVDHDLNRLWTPTNIRLALANKFENNSTHELKELRGLLITILEQIERYQPEEVIVLDLHTTSSDGGIFTIPSSSIKSEIIATGLHAPIIKGIIDEVEGTTLHYFNDLDVNGAEITALTFEAGQHFDPLSVNRCIAAILGCMRSIESVLPSDIENIHDQILIKYSKPLPKKCKLLYKHEIKEHDRFKMEDGYDNFQVIKKGQILAQDKNGPIYALTSGRILMPLYQDKGEDGFFIIEDL